VGVRQGRWALAYFPCPDSSQTRKRAAQGPIKEEKPRSRSMAQIIFLQIYLSFS
jgi:hypothetical protein